MQQSFIQGQAEHPFEKSLSALAHVALNEASADGYVYFQRSPAGHLVRLQEYGTGTRPECIGGEDLEMAIAFPLRVHGLVEGVLQFVFTDRNRFNAAQTKLKSLAPTIEKVWAAQQIPQAYRDLLECISILETEILDSKIASRASGLLDEIANDDGVDDIARHVDTVLRPTSTFRRLQQILEDLQNEMEERKWFLRAKSVLQNQRGMSEKEAHSFLRKFSRQSRRRFVDVAREVAEKEV